MPRTGYQALRLLLADDHEIVRDGLRAILTEEGFDVVGEASNGLDAVRLCEELQPDVAVLDIGMPLLNGIDAARQVLRACPRTKPVLLSMPSDERFVLASRRAGIPAYVLKSKAASNLVQAIHAVCKGEVYLSPSVSRAVMDTYLAKDDSASDPLSTRERQVLQLIAEGKNVKEIGGLLGISTKTAESHRTNIQHRLRIFEVASLTRYAIRQGLIGPE